MVHLKFKPSLLYIIAWGIFFMTFHSCAIQKQHQIPNLYVAYNCTKMAMDNCYFTDRWGNPVGLQRFRHAYQFSNGLAAVQEPNERGKWGYVNEKLELVIPYKFDMVGSFGQGADKDYAWVKYDLDEENIYLSPWIASGPSAIINKKGQIVSKVYGYMQVGSADDYGVTLVNSGTKPEYTVGNYSYSEDGHWGAIDGKGREVIPCKYDFLIPIQKPKLFIVSEKGKWGAISYKGRVMVPIDFIGVYYNGIYYDGEVQYGSAFNSFKDINDLDVPVPKEIKPFTLYFVQADGTVRTY